MVAVNLRERFRNGELDLSSCGLKEIPKDITTMKNILSLNLSNNKIASVGKIIGKLTHLQKLNLSKNHIRGLPENIGNLTNLKQLDLSNNQITTLPITIGNLKNLKHLNMKNNPLAQKFVDIIGTSCQNEGQCQLAAKNVLKVLSVNTDNDKKKKQNTEKESRKIKNEKTQNGNINQQKQKDRKIKKSNSSVFGKLMEKISYLFRTLFLSIFLIGISVYILSFYDENRYKVLKTTFYPYWYSVVTQILTPEQAVQLETRLLIAGNQIDKIIVNIISLLATQSKQTYTYLTTDETIQEYVNTTKISILNIWTKISNSLGNDQKQQS